MYNIILHNIAQDTLKQIFQSDKKLFARLQTSIDELAHNGLESAHTKKLKNTRNIFRKRTGRWRILFTVNGENIDIWIVAMEKDGQKDYNRWIQYVSYHLE